MLKNVATSLLLAASTAQGALNYVGVDWTSLLIEERNGISYKTVSGQTQPLERILADNGVDTVRQRVWVNPADGDYNMDYNIQLAKRAQAVGLEVYIDFHYSDTWADPAHQTIPTGWPTGIDDLSWKLYNYTMESCNAFQAAGIQPNIISIGNEIRSGFLWPTGSTDNMYNIARLLNSAAWGIKDSTLSTQPKIMIHLDNGWDWGLQQWWYDTVLDQGPLSLDDFDMIGVSFYPFYGSGATLAALRSSMSNIGNKYGKEVVVAEVNWPNSCPNPSQQFPSDVSGFPFSADGQRQFLLEVADIVEDTPNGSGLFYWEPAWMNNQGLGSSCDSNTLFTWPGNALSSLSVFAQM